MTIEMNYLTGELLKACNARDIDSLADMCSADYEGTDVGAAQPHHGPEGVRQALQRYLYAFPDLEIKEAEGLTEGNQIAVLWTAQGTHRGALMNIPPTGRKVEVRGTTYLWVEDGKFKKGFCLWDVAGLLRSIGLLPEL